MWWAVKKIGNLASIVGLIVNKLPILSTIIIMTSFPRDGVYYEEFEEIMRKLVSKTNNVDEGDDSKLNLLVLLMMEKDYLPSGWMKLRIRDRPVLQPEPVSCKRILDVALRS